jgi:hypothetical protein
MANVDKALAYVRLVTFLALVARSSTVTKLRTTKPVLFFRVT